MGEVRGSIPRRVTVGTSFIFTFQQLQIWHRVRYNLTIERIVGIRTGPKVSQPLSKMSTKYILILFYYYSKDLQKNFQNEKFRGQYTDAMSPYKLTAISNSSSHKQHHSI